MVDEHSDAPHSAEIGAVADLLDAHLPGDYTHLFFADAGTVEPKVRCRCGWRGQGRHSEHVATDLLSFPPASAIKEAPAMTADGSAATECSCDPDECLDVGATGCYFGTVVKRASGHPADGTNVIVLAHAMVGITGGTPAVVRHQSPDGHSNMPRLVWLELNDYIHWSFGDSEAKGFWAARSEYEETFYA